MKIIVARRRIFGTLPHLEYRVLTPFDQLSLERQNLIYPHSDHGVMGGPWVRTSVLAPLAHPRSAPGSTRYHAALRIAALAKPIDPILVRPIFPLDKIVRQENDLPRKAGQETIAGERDAALAPERGTAKIGGRPSGRTRQGRAGMGL